jgi:predicted DNA-binding protein (UPF0278 family)
MRTERVAKAIAARIVAEVNLDDFYWTPEEVPERIEDVTKEIVRCGRPASVFYRLWKQQHPISDSGLRADDPYGWEGIDEHCRHIGNEIAREEVQKAVDQYERDYGKAAEEKT